MRLIAAMNAWVLDKERTLGELLEEQGARRPGTARCSNRW